MPNIELPTSDFSHEDKTFRLTALPYQKGQEVLARLMNLVGPALKTLPVTADGELDGAASMAPVMADLFARISANDLKYFSEVFLERTEVQREAGWVRVPKLGPGVVEGLFAANYGLLLRLIGAHIELNFKSFLAGALDIGRRG